MAGEGSMMTVPVLVESQGGAFTASVLGNPAVRAIGPTKDAAVAGLKADLASRVAAGDLVFLDVGTEPKGLLALAGRYADDETSRQMWDELVAEAYRYRDELKAQEFPE
jgi:hypothetical protein